MTDIIFIKSRRFCTLVDFFLQFGANIHYQMLAFKDLYLLSGFWNHFLQVCLIHTVSISKVPFVVKYRWNILSNEAAA